MAFEQVSQMFTSNPLIDKATTDNEQPTPGYLYSDINKITFQGSKACERVRDQLLYKLKQKSLAVKIKTLMVMKHLLEQGHTHFQTLLQQSADEIKPCVDIRGPPDPLRGDAPYRMVRDKAQQVMNLLYETRANVSFEPTSSPSQSPSAPAPSSNSFGSSASGRGPTAIASNYQPTQKPSTVEEMFNSAKSALGIGTPANAGKSGFGGFSPATAPGGTGDKGRYTPSSFGTGPYSSGPLHMKSHTTTSTQLAYDHNITLEAKKAYAGWQPDSPNDSQPRTVTPEEQLVETLCTPSTSPTQIQPTRVQLSDFVKKSTASSNPGLICYYLASTCSDTNWKKRLRALHGIHELLLNQFGPALEYFGSPDGLSVVIPLTTSAQDQLKTKAQQIMDYINTNLGKTGAQPSSETQKGNLLDMNASGEEAQDSIFGSLTVSSGSSTPATAPSLLGGDTSQTGNSDGSGFSFISSASGGSSSQGVSNQAVTNSSPTLLPVGTPSAPPLSTPAPSATTPPPSLVPVNQALLSGLTFGVQPGLGIGVVPPTLYYGGGLTAVPYGVPTGMVGLGGMGLTATPMVVTGQPTILSNSGSGSSGAFSFVADTPSTTSHASGGDADPFSFVKIQ